MKRSSGTCLPTRELTYIKTPLRVISDWSFIGIFILPSCGMSLYILILFLWGEFSMPDLNAVSSLLTHSCLRVPPEIVW